MAGALACGGLGTPPYAHRVARPSGAPAASSTPAICIASSRVGARISTDGAVPACTSVQGVQIGTRWFLPHTMGVAWLGLSVWCCERRLVL
jgi:hypothetical protein